MDQKKNHSLGLDEDHELAQGLLSQIESKNQAPVGRMTVRDNLDDFPQAVFEDDEESNRGEMVQELEEDTLEQPVPKKQTSDPAEFDFEKKVEEEDNPFHYVQNKGTDRPRRRSSFAGSGFEKLASTE